MAFKKIPGLRSSYEKVGGVIFFGRMLNKIGLHAEDRLASDYNRGFGFDGRTCRFLKIDYEKLVARVLQGGADEEILEWCHTQGWPPSYEEIFIWTASWLNAAGRMMSQNGRWHRSDREDGSIATRFKGPLIFT